MKRMIGGLCVAAALAGTAIGQTTGYVATTPQRSQKVMQPGGTGLSVNALNSVLNAALYPGADIGAQANAAIAACGNTCEVDIPAGTYSFATTIGLPLVTGKQLRLRCLAGAFLTYTGSGDAIATTLPGASGPVYTGVTVEGCKLSGTSAGASGIHLLPSNGVQILYNTIYGFSAGEGILDEGSEGADLTGNIIYGNQIGELLQGTGCTTATPSVCSHANYAVSGYTSYSTNAVHTLGGNISSNGHWGIEALNGAVNNQFVGINLEGNGTAGSSYGAALEDSSTGDVYLGNYFEASPRYLVVGTAGSSASGTVIEGNSMTVPNTSGYTVELVNALTATVSRNVENPLNGGHNTCFVNVTTAPYLQAFGNTMNATNPFCTAGAPGITDTTALYTDTNNWLHVAGHFLSQGPMAFDVGNGFQFNNGAGNFQNFGCTDAGACNFSGSSASLAVSGPVTAPIAVGSQGVTVSAGANAGTGATAVCHFGSHCTLSSGLVMVTTGTSPAIGAQFTVTSTGSAMPYTLNCTVASGGGGSGSGNVALLSPSPATTATGFTGNANVAPGASTIYYYGYTCAD